MNPHCKIGLITDKQTGRSCRFDSEWNVFIESDVRGYVMHSNWDRWIRIAYEGIGDV